MKLKLAIKRLMDAALSAALLILLAPVFATIAILVKTTSRGPALFPCDWIGKDGRPFRGYKFRSMVTGADELEASLQHQNEMTGPAFKLTNDPRVTPLGRVLRKYSLDELPQLLSVVRGDMSLVGPRPYLEREVKDMEGQEIVILRATPGMTGMWQVSDRNTTGFSERLKMDVTYVRNWSPWLDIYILARTFEVVIRGTGV